MIFSGGDQERPWAALAVVALLGLGACSSGSSSDDAPAAQATSTSAPTPTPDQADVDVAEVTDLVTRYWAAQVATQNAGDESAERFEGVAQGPFIETTLKSIRDANGDGVQRSGRPAITEVEVVVSGDSATIRVCLDEDDWPFVKDGKSLSDGGRGSGPWGAQATRSGESWIITDVRLPPQGEKVCA